jgi:hypothetical protein
MAKKPNPMKQLEDRLNSEDALRKEFLKDPVSILKREGIELTADQARSVRAQFTNMQLPNVESMAAKPKIVVEISISVRF